MLLADRRAGRRSGPLPWAALIAGVAASVAANVAVAAHDAIGRVVTGWPALTLLIAVKLLSGLLDRPPDPTVADGPPVTGADHFGAGGPPSAADRDPSTRAARAPDGPRPTGTPRRAAGRKPAAPDVMDLLPAARAAHAELTAQRRALTRTALARRLRAAGHTVSSDRASTLVKILKSEIAATERAA